jgi:hypothetical protein
LASMVDIGYGGVAPWPHEAASHCSSCCATRASPCAAAGPLGRHGGWCDRCHPGVQQLDLHCGRSAEAGIRPQVGALWVGDRVWVPALAAVGGNRRRWYPQPACTGLKRYPGMLNAPGFNA